VGLYFEDIEVDSSFETAHRTVTEADIVGFCGISGDFNQLHTDEEYCRKTPYGGRIAHGPLVLSMAMGLMNRTGFSDGTALGFLAIEDWRFLAPVKIGDTIGVTFHVVEKRPSSKGGRGVVKRRVEVRNQRGEKVQEGTTVTMVRSRDGANE